MEWRQSEPSRRHASPNAGAGKPAQSRGLMWYVFGFIMFVLAPAFLATASFWKRK